jgi:hypothetical protein
LMRWVQFQGRCDVTIGAVSLLSVIYPAAAPAALVATPPAPVVRQLRPATQPLQQHPLPQKPTHGPP